MAMIPNTRTQRGVPLVGPRSDSTPVLSRGASGAGGGSATAVSSLSRSDVRGDHTSLQDILSILNLECLDPAGLYTAVVPKLWTETIQAHRQQVRGAILDTTVALVAGHGLRSVTMSKIAEETGIGRATLYKYFPDVEAILVAWHYQQISGHLAELAQVRDRTGGGAGRRLHAVLEAYAGIAHDAHGHHDSDLVAFLHRDQRIAHAQQQLADLLAELLTEGADAGEFRDDVAPSELASYCLHALTAASSLPSKAAVGRLVAVIVAGLQPPPGSGVQRHPPPAGSR
jgi:AcrR family transcriptional regulator